MESLEIGKSCGQSGWRRTGCQREAARSGSAWGPACYPGYVPAVHGYHNSDRVGPALSMETQEISILCEDDPPTSGGPGQMLLLCRCEQARFLGGHNVYSSCPQSCCDGCGYVLVHMISDLFRHAASPGALTESSGEALPQMLALPE